MLPIFQFIAFFHLKKIELRFFYLQFFVTGASLNSTAPVCLFIKRHRCAVTKMHLCGDLYISIDNKKSIFKAPKLLLGVCTKIYCWFCSNAGRKYRNYIEWKNIWNPTHSIIFLLEIISLLHNALLRSCSNYVFLANPSLNFFAKITK